MTFFLTVSGLNFDMFMIPIRLATGCSFIVHRKKKTRLRNQAESHLCHLQVRQFCAILQLLFNLYSKLYLVKDIIYKILTRMDLKIILAPE